MKFKGIDPDGNSYFGHIDNETLTLCNVTDGKTNVIRIRRYVAEDKNGNEVYEGDTVILPKKIIEFPSGNTFDADGSELRVPFAHEPKPFTIGALAIIISYSKLQRSEKDRRQENDNEGISTASVFCSAGSRNEAGANSAIGIIGDADDLRIERNDERFRSGNVENRTSSCFASGTKRPVSRGSHRPVENNG